MITHFDNLDLVGVINDAPSERLPYNAWTDARNVRFRDGAVEKFQGQTEAFGTPSAAPYYAFPMQKGLEYWWVYASLTGIYSTDGSTHYDITPTGGVGASEDTNWTGGVMGGGVAVMNDALNAPYGWNGTGLSDAFTALPNWPSGMTAKVLRPFKQVLVAANIDEGSGQDATLLRWSHPAAPGDFPASWDYTDDAFDAGRTTIAQGGGAIIELEPLRDMMLIYKDDSVWSMQYVGGNAIYAFRKLFDQVGIMSRRCVKEVYGRHVVLTTDDIIVHDGTSPVSILTKKMRKFLFNNMDGDYAARSYIVPDFAYNEVWICYPETGETLPNMALVWSWQDGALTVRELGTNAAHIARGIVSIGASPTFGSAGGTFADYDTTTWDGAQDVNTVRDLLLCDTANTLLLKGDVGNDYNGVAPTAYVYRENLPLGRISDDQTRRAQEQTRVKYIKEVWPVIEGTDGGTVTVYIGSRMNESDPVSWSSYTYTIGQTNRIPVRVAGRYIDIKFESTDAIWWRLISYAVNYDLGGMR